MKTALLFLALCTTAAFAQPNTCGGLTSVTDGQQPVYPPIARAAHVSGIVIMLVSFKTTGEADTAQIVSGPMMLRQVATEYVKTWKANTYSGPRMCPIVITYQLTEGSCEDHARKNDSFQREDVQHLTVYSEAGMICDPAATITKRRHRFIFF